MVIKYEINDGTIDTKDTDKFHVDLTRSVTRWTVAREH